MVEIAPTIDLAQYRGELLRLANTLWSPAYRRRADPSDLVHLALVDAYQELARGTIPNDMLPWLRKILKNTVVDMARKFTSKKQNIALELPIETTSDSSPGGLGIFLEADLSSPSKQCQKKEQLAQLTDALLQLPDDQQQAVALRFLHGLTVDDIAEQMGKTEPAIAGLLCRGVRQLKELMKERV